MADQEQLSFRLSSDTVYVYGTVNGVEANFELTGDNVWSSVVDKSVDNRYDVQLTLYNSLGTPTNYHTVLFYLEGLIPPKMDWSMVDYYNFYDLDRVEANTQFIAQVMNDYGREVSVLIEIDRDEKRIEYFDSLNRIEGNQQALVDAFYPPGRWEPPKLNWESGQRFDYRDANRLERNLYYLYELLLLSIEDIKYCGTFTCGEEDVI